MKKSLVPLLLLGLFLGGCAVNNSSSLSSESHSQPNPFDYDGNYENPELTIDGVMNEDQWKSEYASETVTISYVNTQAENDGGTYTCQATFYRGISQLCAFFNVTDSNICTVENDNGDNVALSDSVEIYLDTLHNGGEHPQDDDFQIDLGVHSKTRILIGTGSGWSTWTGLVSYETVINGTMNDETDTDVGYSIEVAIPYKQLGITRDSILGLSLGLVNKYSLKTTTSKMWYGLRKDGHFGSVQVPNQYFTYGKKTITPPEAPAYDPSQDSHAYVDLGTIPGGTKDNETIGDIGVQVSRSVKNELAIRFVAPSSGFNENFPLWVFLDAGAKSKTTRDRESWSMRISSTTGILTNFFYLDGSDDAIPTAEVITKKSSNYVFVSYPLSVVNESFGTRDIALAFATANNDVVYKTMPYKGASPSLRDPSTFVWFTPENQIYVPAYDAITDSTVYLADKWTISATNIAEVTIPEITVEAARHDSVISVRFHATTGSWNNQIGLWGYFDSGDQNKTARDEHSFSIRIVPTSGNITDFFYITPNKAIDKSFAKILISADYVFLSLDISNLGIALETNFGIAFSTATLNDKKILKRAVHGSDQEPDLTNPSSFVWLNKSNQILGASTSLSYLGGIGSVMDKTIESVTYRGFTPSVSRSKSGFLYFKFVATGDWLDDEYIVIYLDKGEGTDTSRTQNTFCLRFCPKTKTIKDFFFLTSATGISQVGIIITGDGASTEIGIPLANVAASELTLGFSLANARTTNCTILNFLTVNGTAITGSNPSLFLRIKADNTMEEK